MDDSCAVCAESLEWVAYGSCGHKEVCSTCVARLRFICDDRRCCICKTESTIVFVTKALGDYTKMINDFSVFPAEGKEGRTGSYWYHEDTQAYFDDLDHYKMIKAMCRLSCSVCDKKEDHPSNGSNKEDQPSNVSKRRPTGFRNIGQLKGHLYHQHRLWMCILCLEGRKVFICEQKLYSKAQLRRHIDSGDSEVDGTESERGGFMGHPSCEFCKSAFYGDNELYTHMSTEHYTCHICQRQHPGQYEYFKNYDDLEVHFRQEHFLCEDEACLSKKFIVFQSEAEMKRHNALEHGGRMSRSKRNAALQLPTSFRYRHSNEQGNRRGRGQTFQRDLSDAEFSRAIEASLVTANVDGRFPDSSSSSSVPVVSDLVDTNDFDPLIQSFEALGTDTELPSRYLQAASHGPRNAPLQESAFPPLSTGSGGGVQKPINDSEGLPRNTMAEKLRNRQNQRKINVLNTGQAWPAASRLRIAPAASAVHSRSANTTHGSSVMSAQIKSAINPRSVASNQSSAAQAQPSSVRERCSTGPSTSNGRNSMSRISHSSSAPNLVDAGSITDFPPVSSVQLHTLPPNGQSMRNMDDVYTANKTMIEKIRAALENDEDKYSAFKDISGEYRRDEINAGTYLAYVEQFGLSRLVPELASLCPDPSKGKELIAAYNANQISRGPRENGWGNGLNSKGKSVAVVGSSLKDKLTSNILSTVRELQSGYRTSEEEVERLSKDGYRAAIKGKSKVVIDEPRADLSSPSSELLLKPKSEAGSDVRSGESVSNQTSMEGDGRKKQNRKKTSKFHRVRLGDGSVSALLDLKNSDDSTSDSRADVASDGNQNHNPGREGLPVRGVWRNGGGQRLLSKATKG